MLSCFVYDHGESARSWNLLGFLFIRVTDFSSVSRLVLGAYDTINIPSIEEDEVRTHEVQGYVF